MSIIGTSTLPATTSREALVVDVRPGGAGKASLRVTAAWRNRSRHVAVA